MPSGSRSTEEETVWRWWVVVAVAAVRAVWVLLASEPVISNDSMRYWNPEDPWMVFRLDLAQGPGQLVQVLYLILPPTVAIAVQALAAGLLWGGPRSWRRRAALGCSSLGSRGVCHRGGWRGTPAS